MYGWCFIAQSEGQLTVDSAITVLVSLSNHLINLIIGELLADRGHDVSEFSSGNETVVITIENLESLTDLLLRVSVLHLAGHHIDGAVVVGVDLVDHVLQLRLGGVLAERAHNGAELLGGNLAYSELFSL
ncbi:hypothetical protein HG530_000106 [Fusarium avenaceum]|nr:hypothetical protein HG530_000106 [Fusarium avenaceum]